MNLSKVSYLQAGGVAVFIIAVALLVASFSGQVKVTVTPSDAKADGMGAGAQHISGMFIPDESAPAQTFGSATGPDRFSPDGCETVNGMRKCSYRSPFNIGTSTVCSFKMPAASSTVILAQAVVTNGQGNAFDMEWGKSPANSATTTSLGHAAALAATAQGTIFASSTVAQGGNLVDLTGEIAPNNFLNFKVGSTTNTAKGTCIAEVDSFL